MSSQPVDHNKPTESIASFLDGVDDSMDAKLRALVAKKNDPVQKARDCNFLSPVELAAMFRTLDGYNVHVDPQRGEKILGTGGFGQVYLATELYLDRPVAIKMLKQELSTSRNHVKQFFEEGVLTSRLQHPGIPPVHAMGLWKNRPAIVMKFVVGKTLKEYLSENQRLVTSSVAKVVDYFLQVCRAVAYAHSHKTWHLDLKPGNVMIGAQDEIQVMDWGLGHACSERLTPATVGGTLHYMPPEQTAVEFKHDIGPHSDVFSLGAMLTEILTGKPPYVANNNGTLNQMAKSADLADCFQRLNDLETVDPALAPLTSLARWCLSKDPSMRPRNAGIVVEALTTYQEGLRLRVQQEIADRARREQQAIVNRARFRARSTILGTVALILLIATGGALWSIATTRARNVGFLSDLDKIDYLIRNGSDASIDEAGRNFDILKSRTADFSVWRAVQQSMDKAKADLDFIAKRNNARQSLAEFTNGLELNTGTALQYGTLFLEYGIIVKDTDQSARRIRGSRIQSKLVASLDQWSLNSDDAQKPLLWHLAMEASQPGWRQEFHSPKIRENREALKSLVKRIPWGELSEDEFESAARVLSQQRLGAESLEVLRKAVQRFPNDFWLNLLLGQEIAANSESEPHPVPHRGAYEAISYLRAALGIKKNAYVYSEIARVCLTVDDLDAAEEAANQALIMDSRSIAAHYYMAQIRLRQNRRREAESIVRQALGMVKALSPLQQSHWVPRLNDLLK